MAVDGPAWTKYSWKPFLLFVFFCLHWFSICSVWVRPLCCFRPQIASLTASARGSLLSKWCLITVYLTCVYEHSAASCTLPHEDPTGAERWSFDNPAIGALLGSILFFFDIDKVVRWMSIRCSTLLLLTDFVLCLPEYEDGSLATWVNKERFQGYLQIDGFTLYELGETGDVCIFIIACIVLNCIFMFRFLFYYRMYIDDALIASVFTNQELFFGH